LQRLTWNLGTLSVMEQATLMFPAAIPAATRSGSVVPFDASAIASGGGVRSGTSQILSVVTP
jgi:hypothetical protein